MDRLNQLRGEAGTSQDSTLDTSSPPSEAYITANESSKFFSLSEVDSTFDITPIKDVSSSIDTERSATESDRLLSNLSPVGKKNDFLDSYKIGKQIEAANILSGGVDIFDDNDNSYDGDELVIDDNVECDDKRNVEIKLAESPIKEIDSTESHPVEAELVLRKDTTEVILQIDGKNVDAIDIGNGLYLYRCQGEEELAAVQIDENQQQPSYKFLKVRENDEGNLEVYEEIQIEVPKEVPVQEGSSNDATVSHVPIRDITDVTNKVTERKSKIEGESSTVANSIEKDSNKDNDSKSEISGKLMKITESRKSPVVGSFTPMTYHSTPNKEGIPLTKTMVDLQLHPNRHSDNVKKTIEVHTDNAKPKADQVNKLPKESEDKSKVQKHFTNSTLQDGRKNEGFVATVGNNKSDEIVNNNENSNKDTEVIKVNVSKKEQSQPLEADSVGNELVNCVSKDMKDELQTAKIVSEPALIILKPPSEQQTSQIAEDSQSNKINSELQITTGGTNQVSKLSAEQREIKVSSNKGVSSEISEQVTQQQQQEPKNKSTEKLKIDINCPAEANDTNQISDKHVKQKSTNITSGNLNEDKNVNTEDKISKNIICDQTDLANKRQSSSSIKNTLKTEKITGVLKAEDISVVISSKKTTGETKDNNCKIYTVKDIDRKVDRLSDSEAVKNIEQNSAFNTCPSNTESKPKIECNAEQKEVKKNTPVKQDTTETTNIFESENKNRALEENKEKVTITTVPTTEIPKTSEGTVSKSYSLYENTSKSLNDKNTALLKVDNEDKAKLLLIKANPLADATIAKMIDTKEPCKISTQTTLGSFPDNMKKKEFYSKTKSTLVHATHAKDITTTKKALLKINNATTDQKPIGNNHAPVPFGKWTEANRQAFLNKIKETKVPSHSSNGKQIKNSNDLNRRDVLKKIDSQRHILTNNPSTKVQDFGSSNRLPIKKEASVFSTKPITQDSKIPVKNEISLPTNSVTSKKLFKQESIATSQADSATSIEESTAVTKKDQTQRKEINNQDLIDKTIEDIISRELPAKSQPDCGHDVMTETLEALKSNEEFDAIEKRMNELHGFANNERHVKSLSHPSKQKTSVKSDIQRGICNKQSNIPHLLPFPNKIQQKGVKENIVDIDSEEEVIEHEPITGDMDLIKNQDTKSSENQEQNSPDKSKKESVITEKDFDKFVRRNSVTYENCITVNFDSKEPVVQTVQKDIVIRTYSKHDKIEKNAGAMKHDILKQTSTINPTQRTSQVATVYNEEINKNYNSKVQMAYQSAMTVKRQLECPITIIEDKPVKVIYMDSSAEFVPKQLNVQGKELSPPKKQPTNIDLGNTTTSDSLDSDTMELDECKLSSDGKSKTKHQRKQVLTPVETPELELIEPGDLGIEVSPKKKRKIEERLENSPKLVVPKKSYLLGRGATAEDEVKKPLESAKAINIEPRKVDKFDGNHISISNTALAIDNLVKAAELLETQSESFNQSSIVSNVDTEQKTPVKRGRGRPRKYPLPEGAADKTKVQTPQKKPRLSDAKSLKSRDTDEDDDDDSSDGEIIRENWTMGKINENIVCPICNKLFRSENVVFKHVKHCTGPSPNRSDSGNKSPRIFGDSQDSELKSAVKKSSDDVDARESVRQDVRRKRKSRETSHKSMHSKDEVHDSVNKPKSEETTSKSKPEEKKQVENKKSTVMRSKITDHKTNNLICEFCGKTFRQLSYLANHKLQHEKDEAKNHKAEVKSSKSVFSCEVCKKEFRKLHHLVQHRLIHNSSGVSSVKLSRKSSAEQNENRSTKEQDTGKQADDTSAGFRCEPCDKSFRKLHHLVEHRETHDGINRQKNPTVHVPVEKDPPPPQCEVCKKTFRKLHHLIEHKEQHNETSSEKSDDKNSKSSLSTKDIIHECSLCYMVFPNEHSLNKHTIICQRKKRQSATKQKKLSKELEQADENKTIDKTDDDFENDSEVIIVSTELKSDDKHVKNITHEENDTKVESKTEISSAVIENNYVSAESPVHSIITEKPRDQNTDEVKEPVSEVNKVVLDLPETNKKPEKTETLKIQETPKKKPDKTTPVVIKRHKPNTPPVVSDGKSVESSDDDEIRYMLNPDYKADDNVKGKMFMNIRANKRNSLQIERPNSKDLVKRRTSLQNPTKVPRLKPKLIQTVEAPVVAKNLARIEPYTDSDDSDVKYSFPKISKANIVEPSTKETEKKLPRKSLTEKRKSLSTIAKRKSLGKALSVKHKAKLSPVKPIKKRTAEVEHRCDCGQLFSSAALLSRHTVLAHTPPRIRRRRSPPPEAPKSTAATKPKVATTRKSSVKTDADAKPPAKIPETRKSLKSREPTKSAVTNKVKRLAAHKGVPVPEKMKKLMEKFKK